MNSLASATVDGKAGVKSGVDHTEFVHDHDLIDGLRDVPKEEAMHWSELTDDELLLQKKLVRKIDSLVMPLVILVYLMNYIDRWVH